MTSYKITSSAGVDMGIYEGATTAEALDAMARDAGYRDQADAAAQVGPFDGVVVVASTGTLCDYETGEALREATEQETRESIAQAARDGGAGVILVDGRSCYVEGGSVAVETEAHCDCGEWSGERCAWTGPESDTVVVEYMPEQHRASHAAAGNRGAYPHNGAVRIRVERSCADRMLECDGEWCAILEVAS